MCPNQLRVVHIRLKFARMVRVAARPSSESFVTFCPEHPAPRTLQDERNCTRGRGSVFPGRRNRNIYSESKIIRLTSPKTCVNRDKMPALEWRDLPVTAFWTTNAALAAELSQPCDHRQRFEPNHRARHRRQPILPAGESMTPVPVLTGLCPGPGLGMRCRSATAFSSDDVDSYQSQMACRITARFPAVCSNDGPDAAVPAI
jgi:hypothetical protein